MRQLLPWLPAAFAILLHSSVFAGFLAISLHWWQCERLQKPESRRPLKLLRWIFVLLAATVGTLLIPSAVTRWIIEVPLAVLLWGYLLRAGNYLVIILELKDGKRVRDELAKAHETEKKQ